MQHIPVAMRTPFEADMSGLIHKERDIPFCEQGTKLRCPRATGLAEGRSWADNALQIAIALAFTAAEFCDAVFPAHDIEIFGEHWVSAVIVSMVAYVVALQQANYIVAVPLFEHARLFADQFPRGLHAVCFEDFQEAFEVMDSGQSGKVVLDWTGAK